MKQSTYVLKGALLGVVLAGVTAGTAQAQDNAFPDASVKAQSAAASAAERTAPLAIRNELQGIRKRISAEKLGFTVGITPATGKPGLCGTVVPKDPTQLRAAAATTKPVVPPRNPAKLKGLAASASWYPWMSGVRNQASAGTCWAHGPLAALEGSKNIFGKGAGLDLSEEQLNDCSGAGTVCGGWPDTAEKWIVNSNRGIQTEATYPYVAGSHPCTATVWTQACRYPSGGPVKASGYWQVPQNSSGVSTLTDLKTWVSTYGPITTCVYADSAFCSYTSGVFSSTYSGSSINHCVCIVGYDDTKGAWLIKNSWSSGWGVGGYMWIKYGANNIGKYSSLIQGNI